jgi:type IV pilus assembly protein PilP
MSNKIYGCIVFILFLGVCFSGLYQAAHASDGIRHVSNRVKIIRPEKTATAPEAVPSETTSVAAESKPVGTEQQKPLAGIAPSPAVSDQPGEMTEEMMREEISDIIGRKERFYSRKGRVDPFEPFLRQPEPDIAPEEQAQLERRVPRTPLEKIDLSQLTLTAVLRMPTETQALLQEASGKGYVVSEGTYVGNKGGRITNILKDRVVVEEKFLDVFGKVSVRERELKLQQ